MFPSHPAGLRTYEIEKQGMRKACRDFLVTGV